MKHIYLFSGLGADHRVLKDLNFTSHQAMFITWIAPLTNEAIGEYAKRISAQIKHENPILIGLSFGGMMAIEVTKFIHNEEVIVIASAKNHQEIPFYFKMLRYFPIYRFIPSKILLRPNLVLNWLFGLENKSEKELLKNILTDTDPVFFKWAIHQIITWKNSDIPPKIKHIHGSSDRILPIFHIQCDQIIKHGGHFMTINRAGEINKILKDWIR
jgi:pimeloyl-ACP methyl ester carboxylesterase